MTLFETLQGYRSGGLLYVRPVHAGVEGQTRYDPSGSFGLRRAGEGARADPVGAGGAGRGDHEQASRTLQPPRRAEWGRFHTFGSPVAYHWRITKV